MHAKASTFADLRFVVAHLSARTQEELGFVGVPLRTIMEKIKPLLRAGTAGTLVHDGGVVALITWQRYPDGEGGGVLGTTFLATDRFYEPDVPSVRFGKRYMRQIQTENGNVPIVSYCYSPHPKVDRWYNLMGFHLLEVVGPRKTFMLPATTQRITGPVIGI